jgi:hypothetical protein
MLQTSASSYNVNAGGNILETASEIHMNGPAAATADFAETPKLPARTPEHEPWDVHTFASAPAPTSDDGFRGGGAQPGNATDVVDQPVVDFIPFDGALPGLVCGMNDAQTRAYLGGLGALEAPSYTTVNSYGYTGKYQFGTEALSGLGYMKPGLKDGKFQTSMDDDSNWATTIAPDGGIINSKASYLANQSAQDAAAIGLANQNCATMQNYGVDMINLPATDQAGILYAAHLKGVGNANTLWQSTLPGSDGIRASRDGYGTSNLKYLRAGQAHLKDI